MQILEIILVSSAFVSGLAMPLFPSPYVREGSQKAVWTFALALGVYVLFLAICTLLQNYLMLVFASLASMGAGYACGAFVAKEAQIPQAKTARTEGARGFAQAGPKMS
jgi:hypothetical protein